MLVPDQAATLASALKEQGYETFQFGKNHLGDLNKYLPCLHGFDEFFGYLYHLDAMSDPYWFDYPQDWDRQDRTTHPNPLLGDRHGGPDRHAALGPKGSAAGDF